MEIGKPERVIIVEPLEMPAPLRPVDAPEPMQIPMPSPQQVPQPIVVPA